VRSSQFNFVNTPTMSLVTKSKDLHNKSRGAEINSFRFKDLQSKINEASIKLNKDNTKENLQNELESKRKCNEGLVSIETFKQETYKEIESLREKDKDLEKRLNLLEINLRKYIESKFDESITRTQKQITLFDETITANKNTIQQKLDDQFKVNKIKIEQQDKQIAELQKKNVELQNELKELEEHNKEYKKEAIASVEVQVKKQKAELLKLIEGNKEQSKKYVEDLVAVLKQDMNEAKKFEVQYKELELLFNQHERNCTNLIANQQTEFNKKIENNIKDLDLLNRKLNTLDEEIDRVKSDQDSLLTRLKEVLETRLQQFEITHLKEPKQDILKIETYSTKKESFKRNQKNHHTDLEERVKDIELMLDSNKVHSIDKITKEIETSNKKLNELDTSLLNKIIELQQRLSHLENEFKEHKMTIEDLLKMSIPLVNEESKVESKLSSTAKESGIHTKDQTTLIKSKTQNFHLDLSTIIKSDKKYKE